jgi:hypothetical protein
MSLRDSRRTRATLSLSLSPLLAGCLLACSAETGVNPSAATSQPDTAGTGVLHSHVTRATWHPVVGNNHVGWDASCHPAPLALCPLFDTDTGIAANEDVCATVTTPACPDRVDTWDDLMVIDFAIALTSDCRFGKWAPPLLTDTDVVNYLNDLLAFTLQFFGCPIEGTTGKLTFGLVPSALLGHRFTSADLDALADTYSAAVGQALSDLGAPPLTADQASLINAKLTRLSHHVPNTVHSSAFTFSTCAPGTATDDTTADPEDVSCQ